MPGGSGICNCSPEGGSGRPVGAKGKPGGTGGWPGGAGGRPGGASGRPGGASGRPGGARGRPSGARGRPGGARGRPGGGDSPGGSNSMVGSPSSTPLISPAPELLTRDDRPLDCVRLSKISSTRLKADLERRFTYTATTCDALAQTHVYNGLIIPTWHQSRFGLSEGCLLPRSPGMAKRQRSRPIGGWQEDKEELSGASRPWSHDHGGRKPASQDHLLG